MNKKIGILIGMFVMMGFMSGLSALTLRIHNVRVGTNDDLIIHCDGFEPYNPSVIIIQGNTIDSTTVPQDVAVVVECPFTVSQGNRSATGILPAESSGVEYIDITLPGPFVADPSVPDER